MPRSSPAPLLPSLTFDCAPAPWKHVRVVNNTRQATIQPWVKTTVAHTERPLLFVTGCFPWIQMFYPSECERAERGGVSSVYLKECRDAVIITRIKARQWCLFERLSSLLWSVASGSATHRPKQWKTSGNGLFESWDNSSLLNPLWDTIRRQIVQEHQSSKMAYLILVSNEVRPVFTLQGGYFWHHQLCLCSGTIKHAPWRSSDVCISTFKDHWIRLSTLT